MKRSLFIVDYEAADGKYYLMSTLSGNIVAVDLDKKLALNDLLTDPNLHIGNPMIDELVSMGFIIEDDIDEFQLVTGKKIIRSFTQNNYLELTIMPTEKCNFRCVYCYENFEKSKMNNEIVESLIKYVEKNISNRKGLIVNWFGGEPLLAIDIVEKLSTSFIKICKENKKIYSSSITTNAFLLDLKMFERLRKLRINHFQITIDGDKAIHDTQRILTNGGGTFDIIMSNLKDICQNDRGNLWTISLRTNVTKKLFEI